MYTKFALLVRLWHPVSPWRWPKSEKIGLAKYRKYKAASPLPFTFCSILAIFWEKKGAVTRSRVEIKIWPTYCDLAIPRHLSVKKFFGSSTFQFCGCRLQRTFKKKLYPNFQFWLLFSVPDQSFWQKSVWFTDVEFNAKLIDTNLKFRKSKPKKLIYPFLISLFHFEINLIKKRFLIFSDNFGQLETILQVSQKQKSSIYIHIYMYIYIYIYISVVVLKIE